MLDLTTVLAPSAANLVQPVLIPWPSILALTLRQLELTLVESCNAVICLAIWLSASSAYMLVRSIHQRWFAAWTDDALLALAPFTISQLYGGHADLL